MWKQVLKHQSPPERPALDSSDWAAYADHLARYTFAANFVREKSVLDAGTGPGYGASILKAAGAKIIQAIDIHPASVSEAHERFGAQGIKFLVDDCEKLSAVATPIDIVCSFENIEHLQSPRSFLAAVARVLSSDGMLIVSTPDRAVIPPYINGRPANPHHVNEWYREEFLELLSSYFQDVDLKVQIRSSALVRRRQGAEALVRHLKRNPIARVVGAARYLTSKNSYWREIRALAAPSIDDFPILDPVTAPLFGLPWCHFAICKRPINAANTSPQRAAS